MLSPIISEPRQVGQTASEVIGAVLPQLESLRQELHSFAEESRVDRRKMGEGIARVEVRVEAVERRLDEVEKSLNGGKVEEREPDKETR